MGKYNFGIIDGQYILRRNWSIQKNTSGVTESLLLKTFMQSIMKLKREFDFERPLICFDSAPYFAALENPEYKADRVYVNQDTLAELEQKLVFAEGEEAENLAKEIEQYKKDLYEEEIFRHAKMDITSNLTQFGFRTLKKAHWEADNLAFAIAERCRQTGLTAIMITTDHDWCNFRSKEIEYSTPKGDHRYDYVRKILNESKELGIPLYELGILHEIYGESHNNAKGFDFSEEVPFKEFAIRLYTGDQTLKGYQKAKNFYEAMNIRKHLPEVDNLIDFCMKGVKFEPYKWNEYTKMRRINLSYGVISSFNLESEKEYKNGILRSDATADNAES